MPRRDQRAAMLRLLPMSGLVKDAEILALRNQIRGLERQLQGEKVRFAPADRAFLAALLHRLPRDVLRVHGELLVLGVIAPSTVWEILKDAGIELAPERISDSWATFLRLQAEAILAADFFETGIASARPYTHSLIRSQIQANSPDSTSGDLTASPASSTSTNRPPELRG